MRSLADALNEAQDRARANDANKSSDRKWSHPEATPWAVTARPLDPNRFQLTRDNGGTVEIYVSRKGYTMSWTDKAEAQRFADKWNKKK